MAEAQIDIFASPEEQEQASQTEEPKTWKDVLDGEREKPYFQEIMEFVRSERASGKTIYPKNSDVFNALSFTPFDKARVVILGQDPYHGPNQAHGLCFSVRPGVPAPPSLLNIFRELESDLGIAMPTHGCLEKWARQGVVLLNAVLTVQAGNAGSHANKGWERFTDKVVRVLSNYKSGLIFLLWGSYAQKKGEVIDRSKHTVLLAPHPSPLSASRGFFGCKHFSKTNETLQAQGLEPIDWSLDA